NNQINLLVSRLCTRHSAGLWSAVSGLSDFVSFVAFCKKSFCAPRAWRRLRQTASSPRRIRVAAATGRGTLAPLYAWLEKTRRRLHGAAQIEPACLLPAFSDHRQTSP